MSSVQKKLWNAVEHGNIQECVQAFDQGVDIDLHDPEVEATALHVAAMMGHENICRLLLSRGANIHIPGGEHNVSPMLASVVQEHYQICLLLLDHGANIKNCDSEGWTVGHWAVARSEFDFIKSLAARGENFNTSNRNRTTALELAAQQDRLITCALLVALGHGAEEVRNFDEVSEEMQKVLRLPRLHAAAYGGHTDVALEIIRSDSCDSQAQFAGVTPADLAETQGHPDTALAIRSWHAREAAKQAEREITRILGKSF